MNKAVLIFLVIENESDHEVLGPLAPTDLIS